ncbi:MAG: hypothetical protein LBT78_06050 [Tannerella sp.]|jgi:hypothetical protein|nr:hypothetical protein [Tannerella sp.]
METKELEMKKTEASIRKAKTSAVQPASAIAPPEGFMTGDEFERRVKERVTKLYQEHGLL